MHIDPGVVVGAKLALSYATGARKPPSFAAAFSLVIVIEPLLDLAVLAAAKGLHSLKGQQGRLSTPVPDHRVVSPPADGLGLGRGLNAIALRDIREASAAPCPRSLQHGIAWQLAWIFHPQDADGRSPGSKTLSHGRLQGRAVLP